MEYIYILHNTFIKSQCIFDFTIIGGKIDFKYYM